MRAVVQRVKSASVNIDNKLYSSINKGLLVLLGISNNDTEEDIAYIIDKLINLRIFKDENNKMNNSVESIKGEILIVSQFTLYGDVRKGRRPSYTEALNGDKAIALYDKLICSLKKDYYQDKIKSGEFGTMMDVELINDGPVTILLDSKRLF
ncbi:MAG: D-tyrosyl-tRNA(Tyr) deacylase [Spirochaetes bacterium]|nr:D-tyrosyl-tRNA(Tyr) deacylase [Spirochaetota bacterium]